MQALLDIDFKKTFDKVKTMAMDVIPRAINKVVDFVVNRIPKLFVQAMLKFLEAQEQEGLELVYQLRDLFNSTVGTRVRAAKNFFDRIKFIITEHIPQLATSTYDAILLVPEAISHILRCPTTVLEAINFAVRLLLKNAFSFLSLKDEVVEALGVVSGGPPEWLVPSEEFEMFGMLAQKTKTWAMTRHTALKEFLLETAGNVTDLAKQEALEFVMSLSDEIEANFGEISSLVAAIKEVVDEVQSTVEAVTQAVTYFKEKFDYVNGIIETYFGPLFEKSFPRKYAARCSSAYFPSDISIPGYEYEPGIDLLIERCVLSAALSP